jgi:hypothetical protein
MGIAEIKKTASPSFYDGLENMKEVQMNTSSMSFKSINTRGFASVANTRFMQLVDGMDNLSVIELCFRKLNYLKLMFKVWNCFLEHLQLYMVPMLSTDIVYDK